MFGIEKKFLKKKAAFNKKSSEPTSSKFFYLKTVAGKKQ